MIAIFKEHFPKCVTKDRENVYVKRVMKVHDVIAVCPATTIIPNVSNVTVQRLEVLHLHAM